MNQFYSPSPYKRAPGSILAASLISDIPDAVIRLVLAVHKLQIGLAGHDEGGAPHVLQVAGLQERIAKSAEGRRVAGGDLVGQITTDVGNGGGFPTVDTVEVLEVL